MPWVLPAVSSSHWCFDWFDLIVSSICCLPSCHLTESVATSFARCPLITLNYQRHLRHASSQWIINDIFYSPSLITLNHQRHLLMGSRWLFVEFYLGLTVNASCSLMCHGNVLFTIVIMILLAINAELYSHLIYCKSNLKFWKTLSHIALTCVMDNLFIVVMLNEKKNLYWELQ